MLRVGLGPDETTEMCSLCIISLRAYAGSVEWGGIRGLRMSLKNLLSRIQMYLRKRYCGSMIFWTKICSKTILYLQGRDQGVEPLRCRALVNDNYSGRFAPIILAGRGPV